MKLFTVGPVACYPEVLEAMKGQMFSHRSTEYKELHNETTELMREFLSTENQVFLFSSTGTGFMEAAVRNCVDKKMLCCINGSFGERFAQVAASNGKVVEKIQPPLGVPTTPRLLDNTLSQCPDVEAVAITHNETSVGLLNPLPELAKVTKKHDKLLFVDAVSSMGGTELKVDKWNIDVCFASSQKCFGVPPGLGMGSVSDEALKRSELAKNKGWYFDFKLWERYQQNSGTPVTSVIPQIAGLKRILQLIAEWGGKSKYFQLYRKRNRTVRVGIEKLGLSPFPQKGYESPTLTCVNTPTNVNGSEIYRRMRAKGFELAEGYGSLKKLTFRIGNMGYIEFDDFAVMLEELERVLTVLGREQ